ncbi:inositol-3-phosphate synthase [bacterium]|nr:inositol-3-phosphate synthase [bacterium]
MDKIRVGIIGVGNCASALVQGIQYYKDAEDSDFIPGVMNPNLGGYHIGDIEFSAAFDIDKNKVGKDVSEAIFTSPNNTQKFADVPPLDVKVERGMTHDGLGKYLSDIIQKAPGSTSDVVGILQENQTDVVINFLPVGSEEATKWYVEQILEAGCAFINCIPVFIASERYWQKRFEKKTLPLLGDDIKSQFGATILHRNLVNLYMDRGMPIDKTYQLNTGGNTDFLNMLEKERLDSKKKSKTNAVASQIKARKLDIDPENIYIGPSDYVPWQKDNKICFLRIESRHFGDIPTYIDCRLSVEDSPNSAGIVIDAIRCCKLALNHGLTGSLEAPSSYFMKTPPRQYTDTKAKELTENFIQKYGKKKNKA